MPELDGISPNPKRPVRKSNKPTSALPAAEAARRRKLMWVIVGAVTGVIVVVWYFTIGTQLGSTTGDNSAWETLKRKVGDLKSVFRRETGDEKIKEIDVNAPTPEQIQYLRGQVFPDAATSTPAATNENVNTPVNLNTNAS